ncbi:MAG: dihydroneopterin aldolase [Acetobacteraceae bacterium]
MNNIDLFPSVRPSSPLRTPTGLRQVLIRDFVLPARIGAYPHERNAPQRIRINLILCVYEEAEPIDDDLDRVVCYDRIIQGIRGIIQEGHVNLVETLAERIAEFCLADVRVHSLRVRVEKLDIYTDVAGVGVEIERTSMGC